MRLALVLLLAACAQDPEIAIPDMTAVEIRIAPRPPLPYCAGPADAGTVYLP